MEGDAALALIIGLFVGSRLGRWKSEASRGVGESAIAWTNRRRFRKVKPAWWWPF